MSYLSIKNLYKDQSILIFRECYALEKIHGCSSHIKWKADTKTIHFFPGNEDFENFKNLFDIGLLYDRFSNLFSRKDATIYGEAYGGKQQGMSETYGDKLRFVAFDVMVGDLWIDVKNSHSICNGFNIEFVDYKLISTDLESINAERDRDSTQAIRNGCGSRIREGVVLRPPIEVRTNNGDRIIAKHKRDEFMETKTPRSVNKDDFKVLENARDIADEWVTDMRLDHVLQKFSGEPTIKDMTSILKMMVDDVYKEAKGEIVINKEVGKAICKKTSELFKSRLFEK